MTGLFFFVAVVLALVDPIQLIKIYTTWAYVVNWVYSVIAYFVLFYAAGILLLAIGSSFWITFG